MNNRTLKSVLLRLTALARSTMNKTVTRTIRVRASIWGCKGCLLSNVSIDNNRLAKLKSKQASNFLKKIAKMIVSKLVVLIFFFCEAKSSTHWVVTEDGKIKHQLESPYAMKQSDDLVAFIRQERTFTQLQDTRQKLLDEQTEIEKNEDKDTHLESRHYRQDSDCRTAGKKLLDFDLFITSVLPLEHKEIQIADHITLSKVSSSNVKEPNCTTFYDLPYSVHAYDHLEGVQNRRFFPSHPVSGLKASMSFLADENAAANAIYEALQKNSTSWVLYDLAAFYWRMKGNLNEAVECLRRALHFSPENYKDVALVSLANILHRVHYTLNATVAMHHALKISDEYSINYFTLANMYATLGRFNESIHYYEETLKRQEDFETAKKELAAVKCQLKLQEKLENQHLSLQRTLQELQEYKARHDRFLKAQEDFASLHLSTRTLAEQHMLYEQQRMKEGTFNPKCQLRANKSGSMLVCNLPPNESNSMLNENFEMFFENPRPIRMTASNKLEHENEPQRRTPTRKKKKPKRMETEETTANKTEVSNSNSTASKSSFSGYNWFDPSWPPAGSCEKYAGKNPVWDDFPSAYIDPESRGFKVRELITTDLNIGEDEMHPHPWNLPDCADLEELSETPYDYFVQLESAAPRSKRDNFLKNCLYTHVNKGYVWPKDLGQRILTALQRALDDNDVERKWILYNLAGLYWRVEGDNDKAIECLRRSLHFVPAKHSDIPLVGLANIMYRMGKINNSVDLLIFALKINVSEPATYLSMGNALQARNNISGAMQFYNYATILNPLYQEAIRSLFIIKCQNMTKKDKQATSEEIIEKWKSSVSKMENEGSDERNVKHDDDTENVDASKEPKTQLSDLDDVQKLDQLINTKDDLEHWLSKTDSLIQELQSATGDALPEKLSTARQLIDRLTEMKKSLGYLVDEAAVTLGDKKNRAFSCKKTTSKKDFSFASNTSFILNFNVVIDDVAVSDGHSPTCRGPSAIVLDEVIMLSDIKNAPKEGYIAETLKTLLQTDHLETSLRNAMLCLPNSWELLLLTSFFWRISGDAEKAITCMLTAMAFSTTDSLDISLYVISDYLAVLSLYDEAAQVAKKLKRSAEASYLSANIYAAKGDYAKAAESYRDTLDQKEDFAECLERYEAVACIVLGDPHILN